MGDNEPGGEQVRGEPGRAEPLKERMGPRIYVASLSDYNAGRLHGAWLEAAVPAEELHEGTQAMLAASTMVGAEEWAIHDYDGFHGIQLDEYQSLETVARVAGGIAEHGPAFAAFVRLIGTEAADDDRQFESGFLGRFESMEEFARGLAEDLGWEETLDRAAESFRAYVDIDYQALGRDLGTEIDQVTAAEEGGVYVFDLRQ